MAPARCACREHWQNCGSSRQGRSRIAPRQVDSRRRIRNTLRSQGGCLMKHRFTRAVLALALFAADGAAFAQASKKGKPAATAAAAPAPQKLDEEYTKLIKQYLQDPRITTEYVDHMPASDTVPTPLKFFGRIPGTPGELTYAKDIHRYYEALAKASGRAMFWKIGQTEEGRDQVVL